MIYQLVKVERNVSPTRVFLSPQHPQRNLLESYLHRLPSLMYGLAGTKGFCAGMAWDSWRPLSEDLMSC